MPERLFDPDAEVAVLSCCFQSPLARKRARDSMSREDFSYLAAEQMWVAMEELDADEKPVDPVSLSAALAGKEGPLRLLPSMVTCQVIPDQVNHYAEIVRGWAVRRRVLNEAIRLRQQALDLNSDPFGLATTAATRLAEIRDTGTAEVETRLMADLLDEPDDHYDWAVPGLMEKRDRLVITGGEGGSKSFIGRQVGIFAAAGIQPFSGESVEPVRVQILDYENSWNQVRRGSRMLWNFAYDNCRDGGLRSRMHVASLGRIDITRDRDLSRIHREVDVANPDLIIVGPLYKLTGRALQTDDEAAPVLAALDTLRDRGCALIIEAHAGHAKNGDGDRDLRPRGSSALMGWPEFGYGMRSVQIGGKERIKMVGWRGDRSERAWPKVLRRGVEPYTFFIPDEEAALA